MRSFLVFVLCICPLREQSSYIAESEKDTVERVKSLLVSSLDSGLPKVTLEFFLKYEGEGGPIEWRVSNCEQRKGDGAHDRERESVSCVRANIALKDNRSATVVISIEALKGHPNGVPTVHRVTVTDPNGVARVLSRLSDLIVELHRPLPKSPRDLPLPVG
jgi:hypothetical protein